LLRDTQALTAAASISDDEIAAEICAVISFGFMARAESQRSQRKTNPFAAGFIEKGEEPKVRFAPFTRGHKS
jgi:hypothetical protein